MGIQQYMKKRSPVNNICTTVCVRLVASEGVLFYFWVIKQPIFYQIQQHLVKVLFCHKKRYSNNITTAILGNDVFVTVQQ